MVFRDPLPEVISAAGRWVDVAIQVGGSHDLHVPLDETDALRSALCTGLYYIR